MVRMDRRKRQAELSYAQFRAKFGMPDANGHGVVFRFVHPGVVRGLREDHAGIPFVVIEDEAAVRIWTERLGKAAQRCGKHEGETCPCRQEAKAFTHAPDRTVLIAQPVQ